MPHEPLQIWRIGGRTIALDRPRIIGVLNVTPDSFSDGGRHVDPRAAADAAMRMIDEGADMLDIGGESTRPGAQRISANEQLRRVMPVIEAFRQRSDAPISIDTTLSEVARAALDAGADIINDVSAGLEDEAVLPLAAARGGGMILMHRRVRPEQDSFSDRYEQPPEYDDVVQTVRVFLAARTEAAIGAGVHRESIVVDPGLGFGKSVEQNYELIRRMDEILSLGYPALCAGSRKSFIGAATGVREPAERVAGSVAVAVACYFRGVRLFRVHDVAAHRQALAAAAAIERAGGTEQRTRNRRRV